MSRSKNRGHRSHEVWAALALAEAIRRADRGDQRVALTEPVPDDVLEAWDPQTDLAAASNAVVRLVAALDDDSSARRALIAWHAGIISMRCANPDWKKRDVRDKEAKS